MPVSTPELHKLIKLAADTGHWMLVKHAQIRMIQRGFTAPDVERALRGGIHLPRLDEFKDGYWRYRIKGRTLDGRDIQLAVVLDGSVIVVTVIGK